MVKIYTVQEMAKYDKNSFLTLWIILLNSTDCHLLELCSLLDSSAKYIA